MSLKESKHQVTKIESPQPQLIKEVEELEKARDEIKSLEERNIALQGEIEDLKRTWELSTTENTKLEILQRLKKDEKVKMLEEKALVLEHRCNVYAEEIMKVEERNKLLLFSQQSLMDKYQLDQQWQKLNMDVKVKTQELEKIQKSIETVTTMKKEEIEDLNAIRAKFNAEVENVKKLYEVKRQFISEYNEFRKKGQLIPPAFEGKMPTFDDTKKPNIFQRLFKRKK